MSPIVASSLVFLVAAQLSQAGKVYAQGDNSPFTGNPTSVAPSSGDRAVILAVTVNGLSGDSGTVFLQDNDGNLYATAAFLETWNLLSGSAQIQESDGTEYFLLTGNAGVSYVWDHAREEISINVTADQFLLTDINFGAGNARDVAAYTTGGYLNYDLAITRNTGANSNAALFDLALFRGKGLLTSAHIAGTDGSARLMTTWQRDYLDNGKTLRVGDSINNTSTWGRGFLFGGIQYGTNFAVRPDFIPFATPSVSGNALLPSSVDVYVDNVLRSRSQVDAGPFSIHNLPVITGTGDMHVVVTDLLGREQVITQSYFASPALLRTGLVDDTFELGWLRRNYGMSSNDYSDPFAVATYRRGLSDTLTGEASVEVQKNSITGGVAFVSAYTGIASVIETSLAISKVNGLATGVMGGLRYSYLGRRWSANARIQLYNQTFRQLGSNPDSLPEQITSAQVSAPLGQGTFSGSYVRRLNKGESLTRVVNMHYSRKISAHLFASFALIKPLSVSDGTVAALTLLFVGGRNHVGSITLNRQPDNASLYSEIQRATPHDVGTGYRVATMKGQISSRQEASFTRNQNFGSARMDLVQMNHATSSRVNVMGSLATLGTGIHFTRTLDQGFAMVQAGEFGGLAVLLENQVVAYTNKRGQALVRNLQAYQPNRISIDPLLLPLDTMIGSVEQTLIPRDKGGILLDFKLQKVRSAILAIVQADGTPLPPWTPVNVVGMPGVYVTGNRGEVFVDLPYSVANRVIARPLNSPACELKVDQPAAGLIAPFLGPLTCL
jgi:outer membrane usher protein